jgi:putative DNA primase/helicase
MRRRSDAENVVRLDRDPVAHEAADAELRQTDSAFARRFVAQHGHRLRYADPLGGWLLHDGQRFVRDETGEVFRLIDRTATAIWDELPNIPQAHRREWAKFATRAESAYGKAAALSLARYEPAIAAKAADFDGDGWLLNLANGSLDLRTIELRPHCPHDLLLKLAPVVYDPRATAPEFLTFLRRIMADREPLVTFLQWFAGYSLTGDISEQVFLLWSGVGANGKSTLVDIIRGVLGDYAFAADFSTFLADTRNIRAPREDVARLAGARFVSAIEQNISGKLDEGLIKKITGNDPLVARYLYKGSFEFTPTFKVVLACNHRPKIGGSDHAMWRRVWCVPFDVVIPRREWDKHFAARLLEREASGILNWALDGLRQWVAAGDLQPPTEILTATDEYRASEDVLGPFLAEHCIAGEPYTAGSTPLYEAYSRWATAAGEKPETQKQFGEMLRERGFRSERATSGPTKGRAFYRGIALRDPSGDSSGEG